MNEKEEYQNFIRAIKYYVSMARARFIKTGYISMHEGMWYNRNGDKYIIVSNALNDNKEHISYHVTDTQVIYNNKAFEYYNVFDKDTYFAKSTIDDLRLCSVEDFEIIRQFFTSVTGYEFKRD